VLTQLPPPPRHFRPAGAVRCAQLLADPLFTNTRYTGRRAQGKRYERRAQEYLHSRYGLAYVPGPWFRFRGAHGRWRYCQPDGLLFDVPAGTCTVCEIKLQHTPYAFWQLFALYIPVVQCALPDFTFRGCEVTRWYAPEPGDTPVPYALCPAPHRARDGELAVHIWRP